MTSPPFTPARDDKAAREKVFYGLDDVVMRCPMEVGDYTDFYSSKEHASNVGAMFGRDPPLSPQAMSEVVRTQKRFTGKGDLEIVDAMYKEFFDAVAPTLEELMLHHLEWGPEEACALAEALPRFTACRKLSLAGNYIGDKGAAAIFNTLHAAPSIQSMNMFGCGLGDEAGTAIAAVLKQNSTLTSLDLGGNEGMGDAGALALAEAVGCNTTLKSLNLEGTVSEEGKGGAALKHAAAKRAADNQLYLRLGD